MSPSPSLHSWLNQHAVDVEALCLDIDGVLLNGERRLPGSRRLLDLLRRKTLAFVLLTNDGNHSPSEKADRLARAGLTIAPPQIVSCGHAIKTMVRSMGLTGRLFYAMGDTGSPCYAEDAGLSITRDLRQLQNCEGVVIGEEHYDWEPVINTVVNYFIEHPQALLIVPNPDEFYPAATLKIHIAAGGVARFIQQVLKAFGMDVSPIYLGKPYAPIFQLAHDELEQQLGHKISPHKVVMVGDNLASDVAGGQSMGYRTALLLTGVTAQSTLKNSKLIPDMVFKTL